MELPKLTEHQRLTNDQLIGKAVIATEIRTEIQASLQRYVDEEGESETSSFQMELKGEHGMALRHEERLLRKIARRGLMGDFLEADWQNRGPKTNVSEEETVWQAS